MKPSQIKRIAKSIVKQREILKTKVDNGERTKNFSSAREGRESLANLSRTLRSLKK